MGKNIKSYATTQVHSPRNGRESLRQKVQIFCLNMVRLNHTYYSLLNFTSKIFQIHKQNFSNSFVFLAKFKQIKQNLLNLLIYSANCTKFAPIINLFVLCSRPAPAKHTAEFQRITQIPHNSPTKSTNYAKFAHFVNLFYIMFQAPAPAENPVKFQRITQIPRNSPTQSANHSKFAPFAHIIYITFQMPD